MKKIFNKKKLIKRICCIGIIIYVIYIFIEQQKTINSYKTSQEYYQSEIEIKLAQQEALEETKSNINSEEYIEDVAREKLDMYLPNEKVYIDKNK